MKFFEETFEIKISLSFFVNRSDFASSISLNQEKCYINYVANSLNLKTGFQRVKNSWMGLKVYVTD